MIPRVLFDGLWEGAAVIAIASLVNRYVPQRNATTRYAVWFATLLALLVVPVLTVLSNAGALLLAVVQPHAAVAEHAWKISLFPAQPLVHGATGFFAPALRWIPVVWLLGAAVCLARLGASLVRIGRIRKGATPSQAAGDVLISADVAIPIAVGFRKPAIIIPKHSLKRSPPPTWIASLRTSARTFGDTTYLAIWSSDWSRRSCSSIRGFTLRAEI